MRSKEYNMPFIGWYYRYAIKTRRGPPNTNSVDVAVFFNPDGTLAAQHDSPPLLGLYPFWQWTPGDRVEDIHPIDVSQLPRDRHYTIAVGLYDSGSGERLTTVNAGLVMGSAFTIDGKAVVYPHRRSTTILTWTWRARSGASRATSSATAAR